MFPTTKPHCPAPKCPLPLNPVETEYITKTVTKVKEQLNKERCENIELINHNHKFREEHQSQISKCNLFLKKMNRKTGLRKGRDDQIMEDILTMVESQTWELAHYVEIINPKTNLFRPMTPSQLPKWIRFINYAIRHFTAEKDVCKNNIYKCIKTNNYIDNITTDDIVERAMNDIERMRANEKNPDMELALQLKMNSEKFPNRDVDDVDAAFFDVNNKIAEQYFIIRELEQSLKNTEKEIMKYLLKKQLSDELCKLNRLETRKREIVW